MKQLFNILFTYLVPIFSITTYRYANYKQYNLQFKVFNIYFNIGVGKYNYIIVAIFLLYSFKYNSFKGINYNKRFGVWRVKGMDSKPYILNIFDVLMIKNIITL